MVLSYDFHLVFIYTVVNSLPCFCLNQINTLILWLFVKLCELETKPHTLCSEYVFMSDWYIFYSDRFFNILKLILIEWKSGFRLTFFFWNCTKDKYMYHFVNYSKVFFFLIKLKLYFQTCFITKKGRTKISIIRKKKNAWIFVNSLSNILWELLKLKIL